MVEELQVAFVSSIQALAENAPGENFAFSNAQA
jgi:hypothetical protein